MRLLLLCCFISLIVGIKINENVIFQESSILSNTQSRWIITYSVNYHDFEAFFYDVEDEIFNAYTLMESSLKYNITNDAPKILDQLKQQLDFFHSEHSLLKTTLSDYQSLHISKRSILPFVGSALSFLFGTTSESDLTTIRNNIGVISKNQKKIKHVMEESLSILNSTRFDVNANRQEINSLVDSFKSFKDYVYRETNILHKTTANNYYFMMTFAHVSSYVSHVRLILEEAIIHMQNLKLTLNMLSLNHLSPSTISPSQLRQTLLGIQTLLPRTLALPTDPNTNLWQYYQYLTCTTLIDPTRIIIVIPVPLMDALNRFRLYNVFNIPTTMPLQSNSEKCAACNFVAKYKLESSALAVNPEMSKYVLLNENDVRSCTHPFYNQCQLTSPIYPINLSKHCIVALFVDNKSNIQKYCTTMVVPNNQLPLAFHITNGSWAITSNIEMRFSIVCQNSAKTSEILVKPPIQIINVPDTCSASSDHLTLASSFRKSSKTQSLDISFPTHQEFNFTMHTLWKPLQQKFPNLSSISIPAKLQEMDKISMNSLIDELSSVEPVSDIFSNYQSYIYPILSAIGSIISLIATVYLVQMFTQKQK